MGLKCGTINLLHVELCELGLIAAAVDSQSSQNNLLLTQNSVFQFILSDGLCRSRSSCMSLLPCGSFISQPVQKYSVGLCFATPDHEQKVQTHLLCWDI